MSALEEVQLMQLELNYYRAIVTHCMCSFVKNGEIEIMDVPFLDQNTLRACKRSSVYNLRTLVELAYYGNVHTLRGVGKERIILIHDKLKEKGFIQ